MIELNYKLLLIFCMELTWLFDIYFLISFPLIYLWYCYAYKGQIAEVHIAMTELAVEKFTVMMCKWFSECSEGVPWSPLYLWHCQFRLYNASHIYPLFTFPVTTISEPSHLLPGKLQYFSNHFHACRLILLKFMLLSAARSIIPNHYPGCVALRSKNKGKQEKTQGKKGGRWRRRERERWKSSQVSVRRKEGCE